MYVNFLQMNTLSSWRVWEIQNILTGVKLIVTLARFVTQFVPAELKIMVSYPVLKTIPTV
jgi:hypothetical protein